MQQAFAPIDGATTSISCSITSARAIVPGPGAASKTALRIYNSGAVIVFVRVGGSTVTAAATDMPIPAGGVETFTVKNDDGAPKYVAAITLSSTATLYVTAGEGI